MPNQAFPTYIFCQSLSMVSIQHKKLQLHPSDKKIFNCSVGLQTSFSFISSPKGFLNVLFFISLLNLWCCGLRWSAFVKYTRFFGLHILLVLSCANAGASQLLPFSSTPCYKSCYNRWLCNPNEWMMTVSSVIFSLQQHAIEPTFLPFVLFANF